MGNQLNGLWQALEDEAFLADLRALLDREIAPHAERIDREDVYPVDQIRALAAHGLTSLAIAKVDGGGGQTARRAAALFEEVSYHSAAVGISLITIYQVQNLISRFGASSLKAEVLPQFREGLITSYALTEKSHGSDIRTLDTKARRDRGGWVLNGRKSFITSGSAAEAYVILAETDIGVSTFFVRQAMPGIRSEKGPNAATFGLRNGPHVDLILEDVVLPEDHLIGVEGKGVSQAMATLSFSRTLAAAISLGIARAGFDGALDYAMNRIAFDQKIFEFQGLQWSFAEMLTQIDAARLLMMAAADTLDQGGDAARFSSEAKLLASGLATQVSSQAIQICGAYGVTENAPFGRYLRDAKAYEIAGGSSEMLRNTIGKRLAGIYAAGRAEP
jgi:alkylation response protein AidB-like acyl-CoA dehydrogenase